MRVLVRPVEEPALAPLGTGGQLSVYSGQASGSVHFIVDVNGYFE